MPLPVIFACAYLAINVPLMVWLAREHAEGRTPSNALILAARALQYGPALLGLLYLVTIAGDWPFVLIVLAFFAVGFWLLDGLLNYPSEPPRR